MTPLARCALVVFALTGCGGAAPRPVVVSAQGFSFTPATIELQRDQPAKLTFRNVDPVLEHDFQIDRFPSKSAAGSHEHQNGATDSSAATPPADTLHLHAAAGESVAVTITPLRAGTYTAYCTIPGHKDLGMVATVVVRGGA